MMFENKNTPKTPLSDLGEFGLLEHIKKNISLSNETTILGIGDDAAVLRHSTDILVSTDMLIETVHFNMAFTPLKHLGYKSIITNVSDIYAMNGIPTQVPCIYWIIKQISFGRRGRVICWNAYCL